MTWTLVLDEHRWTNEDLTAPGAVSVAGIVGRGWRSLDPRNGPEETTVLLTVLLAASLTAIFELAGQPATAAWPMARGRVAALSADELAACLVDEAI